MSQPRKVYLKFKDPLPLGLEYRLINKYKFYKSSQVPGQWIMFARDADEHHKVDFSDLNEDTKNDLLRRVNRIASCFQDPEANKEQIKIRCLNLAKTLTTKQREFVKDWVRRVIDEDDNPPWEDEDYVPDMFNKWQKGS